MFPRAVVPVFVALAVALFGCGDNRTGAQPDHSLIAIAVSGADGGTVTCAAGTTKQLAATATFADGTKEDITASATWTTVDSTIATVDAHGLATCIAKGGTQAVAAVGTVHGGAQITVTDATLVSLAITPSAPSIAAGTSVQLVATGTFSDHTTQDLSLQVAWSSDTPAHVDVSSTGRASGVAEGTATITATTGGVSATDVVTTTAATLVRIDVTPTNPSIPVGHTQQFTATGVFSDATTQPITDQVTWGSSLAATAMIDPASGLATAMAKGTTVIGATKSGVTGTTTLTVTDAVLESIEVTADNSTIAAGLPVQFTAVGHFSDATTLPITSAVTWGSSDETVAKVSNVAGSNGLAQTFKAGTPTIGATLNGVVGSMVLTVTDATLVSIAVTPIAPHVALGLDQQFAATGTMTDGSHPDLTNTVTWDSLTPAVATISNADPTRGNAHSLTAGTTKITATMPATSPAIVGSADLTVDDAALVSIQVTPVNPSVVKGLTQAFVATGKYTDNSSHPITTAVTWSATSVTGTATISNAPGSEGVATGTGVGDVTIAAAMSTGGSVITGSTTLTVVAATLQSIQVTPVNPTAAIGVPVAFKATGTYSDNSTPDITTLVTWDTDDHTVATISNAPGSEGSAKGAKTGDAVVSATLGGKTGTTTLHVSDAVLQAIVVEPIDQSVAKGTPVQYKATGMFSDASSSDITALVDWESTDETVAKVSNAAGTQGAAATLGTGTTTISATSGTGPGAITGTTTLKVTAATVKSIDVTPTGASATVVAGLDLQFHATATYTDGTTGDITAQVAWASSNEAFAQISSALGTEGLAHGIAAGTTTISATFGTGPGAIVGSSDLVVTAATVVSIDVTPLDVSLAKGRKQQYQAIGHFTDGSAPDITTQVDWEVVDTTVAQISNASGSAGLLTAIKVGGPTNVTATLGGKTGSTTVTVTAAVLESITIAPNPLKLPIGATQALVATGHFSDTSTLDLTASATWASADATVATVTSAGSAKGVKVGTTQITAKSGTIIGATDVTVPTLEVLLASPADGAVGVRPLTTGISVQFNEVIDGTTLVAQTTAGACTGSLQVSANDFSSCLAFSSAPTVTTVSSRSIVSGDVTGTPVLTGVYKIRVASSVKNSLGNAMVADFIQSNGWTTSTDGTCAAGLVISQLYGAGGNGGAVLLNDFVELHNAGSAPANLAGMALQYASATGGSWNVFALPSATVPPGGYFLVALKSGGAVGAPLPTPDATGTIDMAGAAGKIVLTSTTIPLTGASVPTCPVSQTIDFVGYGTTTTCFEGTGPTPAPSTTVGVARAGAGCTDTNVNSSDFAVTANPPVPRNSATTAAVCSCSANETNKTAELDYCKLLAPASINATPSQLLGSVVTGELYEAGITDNGGPPSSALIMNAGYGPAGGNPTTSLSGFAWSPMTVTGQSSNNYQFASVFFTAPPAVGNYVFLTRATRDGTNWTYCDFDGAGANAGLQFDAAQQGPMTVAAP